jgi:hypothetical protein
MIIWHTSIRDLPLLFWERVRLCRRFAVKHLQHSGWEAKRFCLMQEMEYNVS